MKTNEINKLLKKQISLLEENSNLKEENSNLKEELAKYRNKCTNKYENDIDSDSESIISQKLSISIKANSGSCFEKILPTYILTLDTREEYYNILDSINIANYIPNEIIIEDNIYLALYRKQK